MSVHWFVPCRRGAVTAQTTYFELVGSWCEQLERHSATLCRWYGLSEDACEDAVTLVRAWRDTFFEEGLELRALRDGEVTVHAPDVGFEPRLWKGAHRVLLEAAQNPDEPGETIYDPLETTEPKLELSGLREILNPDAPLLVGDVVEMPLFRFLEHAGRGAYGGHSFQPDGSYLLGTSLDGSGVESPPLHDNRTAMRFQTLLDCMVGSFAHPTPAVDHPRAPSAAVSAVVPGPVEDTRLEELVAAYRELLAPVTPGPGHLLVPILTQHQSDPRWTNVDPEISAKLWQHTQADYDGHPPPRVFIYWIRERFEQLRKLDHLDEAREREAAVLRSLHLRTMEGLQSWALDLRELVDSLDAKAFDHVGPSLAKIHGKLTAAEGIVRICKALCLDEHSRKDVADVVAWLREKVAALEAFAADGTLPDSGGASEGPRIHARGMVYAGVLYCAGFKRYYEGPEAWHYYSHGWCRSSDGTLPNALPYGEGLDSFPHDLPVTPGSSCSDTALLLTNYVVRNHGEAGKGIWGKSSVGQTMRAASDGTYYEIQSHYDYMTPEDVGALAPAVTREQQLAGLESVLSKVSELQDRSGSTDGFWLAPFIAAQAEGAWKQVSRSTRDHLEEHAQKTTGGWRPPVYFLKFLSSGLKSHDGDAFALLSRMHDAILSGARDFIRDLRALMTENPHWGTFRDLGPDIEIDCADSIATLESIPSGGFIGRYGDNHELARSIAKAVHYLQKALRSKRKELEKLAASPDKIKDRVGGVRDMSDELGDVNVVSLTSHEWCMVKLYPPEDLMDAAELPRDGFLSAFHPLAGTDYLGPGCRSDGQLFLFEQGARLSRHTAEDKKVRFFGAKPFWFQPIPQNRFEIHLSGKSVCFRNPDRDDSRALRGITRLRDAEAMQRLQSEGPGRPFLVHPTTKPSEASGRRPAWTTATARLVTNGTSMWASRAVPYPTMDEAKGGFATWDEAAAARKRFGSGAPYSK